MQGKLLVPCSTTQRGRPSLRGLPQRPSGRRSSRRREGKRRIWREGAGRGEAAALGGDQGPYKENWSEAEVEPGSAKQRQHMKKSYPNQDATKKGRRLGREKQPPSKESTQETDLWDEAIVGSCY